MNDSRDFLDLTEQLSLDEAMIEWRLRLYRRTTGRAPAGWELDSLIRWATHDATRPSGEWTQFPVPAGWESVG